jgi:sugar lactone lactonase YvrE
MIVGSRERKGSRSSKFAVLLGLSSVLVAAAIATAIALIPVVSLAIKSGRFTALGATVGLGTSIVALLVGALVLRWPVAANAMKFCGMAILIVSLGVLVGACGSSDKQLPTEVIVTPASNSISLTQSLSVSVEVTLDPNPNGIPAAGTVTLTSGTYSSGTIGLNSQGYATIVIPAGSLTAGTDTLSVSFTPTGGTPTLYTSNSGTATVVVTKPSLVTPTVTVTPTPTSITTGQALSVAVTVAGGSGNSTPTGTITLTSGTYTSSATTLSSGAATINIPAQSLLAGADTLTVTYTPDTTSASIYNSASGTASETVTNPPLIAPSVTVTPTPTSISTTQALVVNVALSGGSGNPTPTGTVMLTSGTYSSGAITLAGGVTSINIPADSLTAGTDSLTVTYTPDANSSTTYMSATGTGTVTVTNPAPVNPTITVTATPSSIATNQALSVNVKVSGSGATPTGSVVLSGTGYTSAATTLSSGSATITIPANTLAVGADTLTAAYTPDANSSAAYNNGLATVTVNVTTGVTTAAINHPGGMVFYAGNLYVANSGGNQVLVFSEQLNANNVVTGLTQINSVTTAINNPSRLAFDQMGNLYVSNYGNGTVTVYDTNLKQITTGTISGNIANPLGLAVDQDGNVYVGNNSLNNIAVFKGSPAAGFKLFANLTNDANNELFWAPGAMTFASLSGQNYLLVGLGPGNITNSVLTYSAPLTASSNEMGNINNSNCPTGPSGPTGIAISPGASPTVSTIYIANYYSESVTQYLLTNVTEGGNPFGECPTPIGVSGSNSGIASPEGLAVDSAGNVFVANSSSNTITVYSSITAPPIYTQH